MLSRRTVLLGTGAVFLTAAVQPVDAAPMLQAAIDKARIDKTSVTIPPGRYFCHTPLRFWDNSKIRGDGPMRTALIFVGCNGFVPMASEQSTRYVEISNLFITSEGMPNYGLLLLRTSRSVFRNLVIKDFRTCVRIDGTPHAVTGVKGAAMNNFYNVETRQKGALAYRYGVHLTGVDWGKAHNGGWFGGYIQGELLSRNPPNIAACIFFDVAHAYSFYGIGVSGGRTGFRFNKARGCGVFGAYGQICGRMVHLGQNSSHNRISNVSYTAGTVDKSVTDRGEGNRWDLNGMTNF